MSLDCPHSPATSIPPPPLAPLSSSPPPSPPSLPPRTAARKGAQPLCGPTFRPAVTEEPPKSLVSTLFAAAKPSGAANSTSFIPRPLGDRLDKIYLSRSTAPVWSTELEETFRKRTYEGWQDLLAEEELIAVEKAQLEARRNEEPMESRERESLHKQVQEVQRRLVKLLREDGLILFMMRLHYWAYELQNGVASDNVLSRLSPFPPAYEPTLDERNAWAAATSSSCAPSPGLPVFDTRDERDPAAQEDALEALSGDLGFWKECP